MPSLIRQLVAKPTYMPLRTISSKVDKTITFIGKWSEEVMGSENGLKKLYNEFTSVNGVPHQSTTDLNIYLQSGKFDNPGGFNMLSIEDWGTKVVQDAKAKGITEGTKAFDDYIWETYNKPWLESAMQRGDDIVIWSDPILKDNLETFYKNEGLKDQSFYAREIEFLQSNASKYQYNYNNGLLTGILSK